MAIAACCSTKGGVGKSTLATETAGRAAAAGYSTLLVDMDPQEHSAAWTVRRGGIDGDLADVEFIRLTAPDGTKPADAVRHLRKQLHSQAQRYDLVVCDVGGFDSLELRSATHVANLAVVPIVPSEWNVGAWSRLRAILEEARMINEALEVLGVINQVNAHAVAGSRQIAEARDFLADHFAEDGYRLAGEGAEAIETGALRSRIVYTRHREGGYTLAELTGADYDPRADREMQAVYEEIIHALT